jgi:glutamyl-tRNA synthetase
MTAPRVRFAPSPTGYLHIGGARTALFNWLHARRTGGTFVLRIEDTDRERSTDASVNAILEAMRWLGMDWDEGPQVGGPYGPYFQTQRVDTYRDFAEQLIAGGHAYRSYETKDDLDKAREAAKARGEVAFRYDSPWRDRPEPPDGRPHVVRFKMPRDERAYGFDDLVYGHIEKRAADMEDWIMLRPDGVPTYNYGVTIDDLTMKMTLVARGDDHVNNTPIQVALYEALGVEAPKFAHLPMILGSDKQRLSKRHGAVSVTAYRDTGYLPHALVNYLVRLGWSHGDQEVFGRAELVSCFDFEHVGRNAGVFNPEKLLWLNQHWIKNSPPDELAPLLSELLAKRGLTAPADARLQGVIVALRERAKTLLEMADSAAVFYSAGVTIDEKAGTKHLLGERPLLEGVRAHLATAAFEAPALEAWFKDLATQRNLGLGKVAQPVRVAVTGTTVSPPLFDTLVLIGRDEVLRRLDAALRWMSEKAPPAA